MEYEHRLIQDRIKKVEELKEMGVNPYPYSFDPTTNTKVIKEKYKDLPPESKTGEKVKIAGRVLLLRKMGKITFANLQDQQGKIQLFIRKDLLGDETYKIVKKSDIGDYWGVEGEVITTKTGELSILVTSLTMLSKSIRPLPEKYHGLQDKELRYRRRYLDLIMNQEVKEVFEKRSAIVSAIREFMSQKGFMEVETPTLQTQYGGANARPFITHINAWDMKMYLSISPELYLKRLIVGGFEKVYTICKNFRNEGVDHSHNPEFTMLEAYQAYADYNDMMKLLEEMYEFVALKVLGTTKVKRTIIRDDGTEEEVELDFKTPWKRMTFNQAIKEVLGFEVLTMSLEEIREKAEELGLDTEGCKTWGDYAMLIFDELVEDQLIGPVHVYDRPRESSPLCKPARSNPELLIEQNEPVVAGMEIANMYSELNDPVLQRKLLEEQAKELRAGSEEAHPMDEDFVEAIETGMPPTGGIGIGIDRMALLLLGQRSIRDVILFPTMKPLENKEEKNKQEEKNNKENKGKKEKKEE